MITRGLLEFAVTTAHAAGEVLMGRFGGALEVTDKAVAGDVVTDADRASEALVVGRIRAAYPEHAILAEESGEVGPMSAVRWILDPLDGTTNFARGLPHFCVSIALVDGEGPLIGVVHDPVRGETFRAARGEGAFVDGARGERRLAVTDVATLRAALLATGFPYVRNPQRTDNLAEVDRLVPRIQCLRRTGSAALDLAYVAAGRLDGYWEAGVKAWDVAAGVLLVREAGGVVTRMDGSAWTLDHIDVASGGPGLHRLMIAELRAAR